MTLHLQCHRLPLGQLVGSLQHLHQEGVDGCVTNQLEEEQVFQTLQANGAQRWQSEEELGKPGRTGSGCVCEHARLVLAHVCISVCVYLCVPLTCPAGRGISVCSRIPAMRTPSP